MLTFIGVGKVCRLSPQLHNSEIQIHNWSSSSNEVLLLCNLGVKWVEGGKIAFSITSGRCTVKISRAI